MKRPSLRHNITRRTALQSNFIGLVGIDLVICAQDNYLAEALKARNLLAEFDTSSECSLPPPPPPRKGAPRGLSEAKPFEVQWVLDSSSTPRPHRQAWPLQCPFLQQGGRATPTADCQMCARPRPHALHQNRPEPHPEALQHVGAISWPWLFQGAQKARRRAQARGLAKRRRRWRPAQGEAAPTSRSQWPSSASASGSSPRTQVRMRFHSDELPTRGPLETLQFGFKDRCGASNTLACMQARWPASRRQRSSPLAPLSSA